jgi:hypothetical protein
VLAFDNVTVRVFSVSHDPIEFGDIDALAVTFTARVAVAEALTNADDRQTGVVAESPSGPHAQ